MKYHLLLITGIFILTSSLIALEDALYAQSTVLHSGVSTTSAPTQSDPYKSKVFRVRGVPDLQVNTPTGEIEVISNPQIRDVKVDLYVKRGFSLWSGTRSLDSYRIIMQQRGDQIIASVEDTRQGRSAGGNIEFTFLIQVPAEVSANLRTMHGNIVLDGVTGMQFLQNQTGDVQVKNTSGDIRVVTTTGNVHLENLSGNIFVKSVSGHIHARNNEGEVRLRTVAGNITAQDLTGTLVSATTSGHIEATFREVAVGVYMETVSGNIDLSLPSRAGYTINGKALRFNFDHLDSAAFSESNVSSRAATIVIRDGDLPVNLSTVTGQISVRESN